MAAVAKAAALQNLFAGTAESGLTVPADQLQNQSFRAMRPKIVFTILAIGIAGFLFLLAARHGASPNANSAESNTATVSTGGKSAWQASNRDKTKEQSTARAESGGSSASDAASAAVKAGGVRANGKSRAAPGTIAGEGPGQLTHEEYVDQRVAEMMDLAMNDDAQSLNSILSELSNNDPDIRNGAIEAVKQFGSLDAIPKLEAAASKTDSPSEKKTLEDAIEFLKLPSLTAKNTQRP